jgi:hypothetical protein
MSKLQLRIFDGTRQLFAAPADFLITITDGNQVQRYRDFCKENQITFDLPFFDNFGDHYGVVVWADGFQQAGFLPVALSDDYTKTLDIMLVRKDPGYSFVNARWDDVRTSYPFVAAGVENATGAALYEKLVGRVVACLLNLCEAMSQIRLAQGTPLDYIKQIIWEGEYAPAQDRFFAWCDPALIHQVKDAADAGLFAEELNPGLFHKGATHSWKQVEFGEANVQLTFHENDTFEIDGVNCVMVEPDID